MVITSTHIDAPRYRLLKGSAILGHLTRINTETREYTQMVGFDDKGGPIMVQGVADRIFYCAPGATNWEEING